MNSPNQTPPTIGALKPITPVSSNYRWVICGLLFFSTTFNYMDRQVISYLKDYIFCVPTADGGFGWTNTDFAYLTSFFTAFYAGMTLVIGWVIDRIGTKMGLALSLIFWSICGIANAFVGKLLVMHISSSAARLPWAKRATFPPPSKPSPNGFPSANAPWPRAFSTPAQTPARWSRRCSCR